MNKKMKEKFLKLLELGPSARREDIEMAYQHLSMLYENKNSPEILPVIDEIDESERLKIIEELKNAYENLLEDSPPPTEIKLEEDETYDFDLFEEEEKDYSVSGDYFKKVREKKGLKIKDAAEKLDLPVKLLSAIETEKFSRFNDDGYLRWIILKYADFLGIDKTKAAEDYMKLYRLKK